MILSLLGISHGEDILLIFKTILRTKPLTDDEKAMTRSLIEMWHSFATKNIPTFNGVQIEESKGPDELKYLEIFSSKNFSNVEIPEKFGETKFCMEIENTLKQRLKDEF